MTEEREQPALPRPEIDGINCKGCGRCVISCPKNVLKLSSQINEHGYHYAEYTGEGCIGCANCYYTCPEPNALAVRIPVKKPTGEKD